MRRPALVTIGVLLLALFAQAQVHDVTIVLNILQENNLEWDLFERIRLKNGRIVTLNLDNEDYHLEGITNLSHEIGKLSELKILTLNDNDLIEVPNELFDLTKLTILEIKNNELIDIPKQIGKLARLRELDLRNNEFRVLPNSFVNLKSLYKLQLWGNDLEYLPDRIGNLSSLKELYLRGNRLLTLPVSITKLNLTYIDLLENYMCEVNNRYVDRWLKKHHDRYKSEQYCIHFNNYKHL